MRKFQEILESDKLTMNVRVKFRTLFLNLFDEIIIENLHVGFFDDPNEWELLCDMLAPINDYTYKYFKQVFDIAEKLNLKFTFSDRGRLKVYLKTKCKEFIEEMELLDSANKYNI